MNKFTRLISDNNSSTLTRRASSIATAAQIAQQNIVNQLKQRKCELELKIANLTDLAPESTDSLRPGDKDWDAKKWAIELQETKQELYDLNVQLDIAEETYKEYFEDDREGN